MGQIFPYCIVEKIRRICRHFRAWWWILNSIWAQDKVSTNARQHFEKMDTTTTICVLLISNAIPISFIKVVCTVFDTVITAGNHFGSSYSPRHCRGRPSKSQNTHPVKQPSTASKTCFKSTTDVSDLYLDVQGRGPTHLSCFWNTLLVLDFAIFVIVACPLVEVNALRHWFCTNVVINLWSTLLITVWGMNKVPMRVGWSTSWHVIMFMLHVELVFHV